MTSGMGTQQTTQAHLGKLSLSYRIKLRLKRFLKRTIGHTLFYQAMQVGRHYYTRAKRQANAAAQLKKLKQQQEAQQAQQEQEQHKWTSQPAPFLPLCLTQEPTREHPQIQVYPITFPIYGGTPVQVQYPGQFAGYQPIKRPDLAEMDTQPGGPHPVHLQHLTLPEQLPERIGVTEKEARFLLDQPIALPEADEDETEARLPRVQKEGEG